MARDSHPIISSFERFFAAGGQLEGGDLLRSGSLLLSELNCLSCHRPDEHQEKLLETKQAPILDGIAGRVRSAYLRKFLRDSHGTKPGTAMPDLFAGFSERDRDDRVEALVHFLAMTGSLQHQRTDRKQADIGRDLYNRVGCAVCHGSRDRSGKQEKLLPASVPLGDLTLKYTVPSLAAFLENPQSTRPSGRMPGLLDAREAREAAHYLLQGLPYAAPPPNMKYAYFEGHFDRLPDFGMLQKVAAGETNDFDLTVARRPNDFALTFHGYLGVQRAGTYRFFITSDDGAQVRINGKTVVSNDGIHPPTTASAAVALKPGMHKLDAAIFNAGGGVELKIEIEGPALPRQPISPMVFLTEQGNPPPTPAPKTEDDNITVNPSLADNGRKLFASMGCANCHTMHESGKVIAGTLDAPALAKLRPDRGCLAPKPGASVPHFGLNAAQRFSLVMALNLLEKLAGPVPTPRETIHRTMLTFNCYACHERDKIGGREESTNAFFTTTQPEMGDEGRLPPPLDGVGAKLTPEWFRKILVEGSHERPYMHVRMPRFGAQNTGHLVAAFASLDRLPPQPQPTFSEPPARVKAAGRHMVGALALGCVKCHTFAGHKAEGIQAIDLAFLGRRLQHDWFHWYLLDPQKVRPLTRMPSAWPMGQSLLPTIFDGDTAKQIEAIWQYLADGSGAAVPAGMGGHFIPLVPEKEAIIYRNFIEGAGPRAIAVGYPEKANLAFDANNLRLALIWQGGFIDASRHWTDRGAGFQSPLGDSVLRLAEGPPLAELAKPDEAWPNKPARELGFKFRGYRLSYDRRPTFLYSYKDLNIEDFPNAVEHKGQPGIVRKLRFTGGSPTNRLYFRAAVGNSITPAGQGWFVINGEWRMRITANRQPLIRHAGGQKELLVPVGTGDGKQSKIIQEFVW